MSSGKDGLCALCRVSSDLQNSHLIPKAAYKHVRGTEKDGRGSPIQIHTGANYAYQSDDQVKQYLLCSGCEELFSRQGENVVAKLWATRKDFPLLSRLQAIGADTSGPDFDVFLPEKLADKERNALFYFALSVFWRAHHWDWGSAVNPYGRALGDKYEKVIRSFLLSGKEPLGIRLFVSVNSGPELNTLFSFPCRIRREGVCAHKFDVLGLRFTMWCSVNLPAAFARPFEYYSSPIIVLSSDLRFAKDIWQIAASFKNIQPRGNLRKWPGVDRVFRGK